MNGYFENEYAIGYTKEIEENFFPVVTSIDETDEDFFLSQEYENEIKSPVKDQTTNRNTLEFLETLSDSELGVEIYEPSKFLSEYSTNNRMKKLTSPKAPNTFEHESISKSPYFLSNQIDFFDHDFQSEIQSNEKFKFTGVDKRNIQSQVNDPRLDQMRTHNSRGLSDIQKNCQPFYQTTESEKIKTLKSVDILRMF